MALLTVWLTPGVRAQAPPPAAVPAPVYLIRVEAAISPGTAGYLKSAVEKARDEGAQALIVELDTPGGLLQSTRTMVKEIMNAPLPVIVYVSPAGAQAASAGVFITLAADLAVMAPGSNIGAAHPVQAGGQDVGSDMAQKVVNDTVAFGQGIAKERGRNVGWVKDAVEKSVSITADEAEKIRVVDLLASSRQELLEKIHGRTITRGGMKVTLDTRTARVIEIEETLRDRVLRTLADPNIAYILMMLGLAGLYFELSHPGAIFPGVVGAVSLILAFYSFQTLPVNYAGILLILLGIGLFILELKIASYGALSLGGLISLTLGSLMLFRTPEEYIRVSLGILIPVVAATGGFFVVITSLVVKAHRTKTITGTGGLVGESGRVKMWSGGQGRVLVHGEWWYAQGEEGLAPGDPIEVIEAEGMRLKVRRKTDGKTG